MIRVFCLAWLVATASAAGASFENSNTEQSLSSHHDVRTGNPSSGPLVDLVSSDSRGHPQKASLLHKEDRQRVLTDIYRPDYIRPKYILDYRLTGLQGGHLKTLPWGPVVVLPQQALNLAVPLGFRKPEEEHDTEKEGKILRKTAEYLKDYHHEKHVLIIPVIEQIAVPPRPELNHRGRDHERHGHDSRSDDRHGHDYRDHDRHDHDFRSQVDHDHHYKEHHIHDYAADHRSTHGHSDNRDRYHYLPKINLGKDYNKPIFNPLSMIFKVEEYLREKHN